MTWSSPQKSAGGSQPGNLVTTSFVRCTPVRIDIAYSRAVRRWTAQRRPHIPRAVFPWSHRADSFPTGLLNRTRPPPGRQNLASLTCTPPRAIIKQLAAHRPLCSTTPGGCLSASHSVSRRSTDMARRIAPETQPDMPVARMCAGMAGLL